MSTTAYGSGDRTVLLPLPPAARPTAFAPAPFAHAPIPPAPFAPAPFAPAPQGHGLAPYPAPPAPRPGMRWGWLVIGLVAAVVAVAGLVGVAAAHRTMTVSGTATISMTGAISVGGGCSQAMAQGMPVSVYDAAGTLVGTTSLSGYGVARTTWSSGYYSSYSSYADSCEYSFSVPDVTTSSSHYRIKLGGAPGDGVGYSVDQLRDGPVGLTLR